MSRRLTRISLALVLSLSSEVWAIGLGDINLDSALNEPLHAEIELLSTTPEELANLTVTLASSETFARYGIDRPFYLQGIEFNIVRDGPDGAIVQVRSRSPITEPFLTFLVEATWSSGRLLREYTVLLDPPTYSPPAVQQAPAVEAPRRAAPTDSARIERQPPAPQPEEPPAQPSEPVAQPPEPVAQPRTSPPPERPAPADEPAVSGSTYSKTSSGDYYVERGDTLWGITSRMLPDSRLTMNQTMLAIFEANPGAFDGNINRLSAGASLRIPSADEVFQISRGAANSEVQRQNEAWGGSTAVATPDTSYADTTTDTDYTAAPDTTETRPSLTLVPPDEEPAGIDYDDELETSEPPSREQEIESRIAELEGADVPDQQSLIEIRDNELATLRQELADIRGEIYEMPADEVPTDADSEAAGDDEIMADTDAEDAAADDVFADDEATADDAEADAATPTSDIRTPRVSEPSIMDRVLAIFSSFWTKIIAALVLVAGLLLWFVRRGRDDDADSGIWETLDGDQAGAGSLSATETMRAPTHDDDAIVVVEQDSGIRPVDDNTVESPVAEIEEDYTEPVAATADSGEFGSLEDTFSSETAVNLDQTDPLAEADFHMAYGLYDQAADLINGALEADPSDKALMSKLCEIYFVWGNQDSFVDAATRLKAAVGDDESAEWDKIVIMGRQIAADHELFAGAALAGATKAVDVSFDEEMGDAAELDMDFGSGDEESDVIDIGAVDADGGDDEGVDFLFEESGDEVVDMDLDKTAESPTIESPEIDATSELPSLDESLGDAIADAGQDSDETAEINLDELDLDISGTDEGLEDTGINEALGDLGDVTGKNPEIDPDETGLRQGLEADVTGIGDALNLDDLEATGMRLAPDETGRMPLSDVETETDTSVDLDLLDATGHTQVLDGDMAVETAADMNADLGSDDATMLAPKGGEDQDFDFARTEALPPEVFAGNSSLDETGEMPVAGTDVDLDLDDLTAALQVSEVGDTVEQLRDDATVEQPGPSVSEETSDVPTMAIAPEDMSGDLHEARTMTEVGTKLDLARAYVDMGDPAGARSILEEVLDEGDEGQRQQAQQLLDSLPS